MRSVIELIGTVFAPAGQGAARRLRQARGPVRRRSDEIELILDSHDRREMQRAENVELLLEHAAWIAEEPSA